MFKKGLVLGLAGLLSFGSVVEGDPISDFLDDVVEKISVDDERGAWKKHLWYSIVIPTSDAFLINYANPDHEDAKSMAANTRFLEIVGHQGIYNAGIKREINPANTLFDLIGSKIAYESFSRLENMQPFVSKLADVSERQNLMSIAKITVATIAIGYTLPGEENLFELNLEEQFDGNNFLKHVGFYSYYTYRTSAMLDFVGYDKHPSESLAWRVAYGTALAKELLVDSRIGKGPSVRDAVEDGLGVALGYGSYKLQNKIGDNVEIYPYSIRIKF
jgi:hypothetical protein